MRSNHENIRQYAGSQCRSFHGMRVFGDGQKRGLAEQLSGFGIAGRKRAGPDPAPGCLCGRPQPRSAVAAGERRTPHGRRNSNCRYGVLSEELTALRRRQRAERASTRTPSRPPALSGGTFGRPAFFLFFRGISDRVRSQPLMFLISASLFVAERARRLPFGRTLQGASGGGVRPTLPGRGRLSGSATYFDLDPGRPDPVRQHMGR